MLRFCKRTYRPNRLYNDPLWKEYHVSQRNGCMSDKMVLVFQAMIRRMLEDKRFKSFPYTEDLEAEALMRMVQFWDRFRPDRSENPYAYYIQVIKQSFISYISFERKQEQIKETFSGQET